MAEKQRIANLLGFGAGGMGYDVAPEMIGAGFESEVVETKVPVSFLNDLDRSVAELTYAEAGLRAQDDGCAAIFINTAGDYGLVHLRAALRIPVVGAGQAAMQIASGLGRRFAIVTVWPPATNAMYERLLRDYGYADRCTEIRHVTADDELPTMVAEDGMFTQMRAGKPAAIDRVERAAREVIDRGADVIILGCTCMSPIQTELMARLGRPVVDPLIAGHKLAELLVTMGLRQVDPPTPPMQESLLRAMVNGSAFPATPVDVECDDCAVLGETEPATVKN